MVHTLACVRARAILPRARPARRVVPQFLIGDLGRGLLGYVFELLLCHLPFCIVGL